MHSRRPSAPLRLRAHRHRPPRSNRRRRTTPPGSCARSRRRCASAGGAKATTAARSRGELMGVSAQKKKIAKHIVHAFGGEPHVFEYKHDTLPLTVALLHCDDRPDEGSTSYSTIGLSDYPMFQEGEEFPVRLEIAGLCATSAEFFPNILASAAFCIMR